MVNREPRLSRGRRGREQVCLLHASEFRFHGSRPPRPFRGSDTSNWISIFYITGKSGGYIVLGKLRYTNQGRRAWYPLRGWWYRSSPDRNIVPRQRLSPSARKSSGSRSPDTGWSGSRHLAKDRPCCPCTCNRQSANRLLLSTRKRGKRMNLGEGFFLFLLEKYMV